MDIELYNLFSCTVARVGYVDRHFQHIVDTHRGFVDRQRVVSERRIAQPVAEFPKRLVVTLDVSGPETRQLAVVVDHLLSHMFGERHREFPRRVYFARKHLGDSLTAHAARFPCFDDGRNVCLDPRQS